jgi:site-specific DNA-methyltransferase (adenine-specific)
MTPFYETELGRLYHMDCFDFLSNPPCEYGGSVRAVITDPPYGINLSSSGSSCSKTGLWTEIENLARFYAIWFKECYLKMLAENGLMAVFGNYKSIPALHKAFLLSNFDPQNAVVWDKEIFGPGMIGFRRTYEIVALGIKGTASIKDRNRADVHRCKWQSQHGETGHPAEKPVQLLKWLVESLTEPGDLVFDPFAGSGTTAIACEETGRRWVGIEMEQHWCEIAAKRLEKGPNRQMILPLEPVTGPVMENLKAEASK